MSHTELPPTPPPTPNRLGSSIHCLDCCQEPPGPTCSQALLLHERPGLAATCPCSTWPWGHLCMAGPCWGAAVAQQDGSEQVMLGTVLSTDLRDRQTDMYKAKKDPQHTRWCGGHGRTGQGGKSVLPNGSSRVAAAASCCQVLLLHPHQPRSLCRGVQQSVLAILWHAATPR